MMLKDCDPSLDATAGLARPAHWPLEEPEA